MGSFRVDTIGNATPSGIQVVPLSGMLVGVAGSTFTSNSPGRLTISFSVNGVDAEAFKFQDAAQNDLSQGYVNSYSFTPAVTVAKTANSAGQTSNSFTLIANPALAPGTEVTLTLKGTTGTPVTSAYTL